MGQAGQTPRAPTILVAGHTRLKALRKLLAANPAFTPKGAPGPNVARVIFHEFASEADANAYALADNRIAEEASWDDDALAGLVRELGHDLAGVAGFDDVDISRLLDDGALPDEGDIPEPPASPITKLGDVWKLGDHVLVCGDSRLPDVIARATARADLLWTDPPYNVAYIGKTKDALTIQSDAMNDVDFRSFLVDAFTAASSVMREGAVFYVAHADSEGFNFRGAVRDVGWKLAQCLIWVKDRFVMGRQDYHWRHEPILYGWKEGAGHHALEDRTQNTVWEIARPSASATHPTMKPIALIDKAIKNSSNRGETVLDTFAGSGSTLIACEAASRKCAAVELDPAYCDVIVERWSNLTGGKAYRAD